MTNELIEALEQIDRIANGLSKDDERLTATASLMRCGHIAREALRHAARAAQEGKDE